MENPLLKTLRWRLIVYGLGGQLVLAVLLFIPGTPDYWQGWAFMAVNFILSVFVGVYFYRRDPELLARRMLRKEKIGAQKIIIFLLRETVFVLYVVSALDHHLGWSRTWWAPVPAWLTILALLGYAGTYCLLIPVMNANRFAASIIQVETGQIVAERGPYRLVRHPMYSVMIVLWLWIPLALGSFVALPFAVLLIPLFVWRLLNEEKMLRRDLPGYAGYCERTRHRLIPSVW